MRRHCRQTIALILLLPLGSTASLLASDPPDPCAKDSASPWPCTGESQGILATFVNSRTKFNTEGFHTSTGIAYYYSFSNLKSQHAHAVVQVAALDMDPKKDLEVGLGLGLHYEFDTHANLSAGDAKKTPGPFGIAAGVGYNLMIDQKRDRAYYWVGLTVNLATQPSN